MSRPIEKGAVKDSYSLKRLGLYPIISSNRTVWIVRFIQQTSQPQPPATTTKKCLPKQPPDFQAFS